MSPSAPKSGKQSKTATWNARKQRALFAVKEDSVDQVGCIHTVQGLEFDDVGVIIGNDLKSRISEEQNRT